MYVSQARQAGEVCMCPTQDFRVGEKRKEIDESFLYFSVKIKGKIFFSQLGKLNITVCYFSIKIFTQNSFKRIRMKLGWRLKENKNIL